MEATFQILFGIGNGVQIISGVLLGLCFPPAERETANQCSVEIWGGTDLCKIWVQVAEISVQPMGLSGGHSCTAVVVTAETRGGCCHTETSGGEQIRAVLLLL